MMLTNQKPRSVASDRGLDSLHMSHKEGARLICVNLKHSNYAQSHIGIVYILSHSVYYHIYII